MVIGRSGWAIAAIIVFHATATAQRLKADVTASVVIRLTGDGPTYRLGQRIPFELEFRGVGDPDYYFADDRCGPFDRFVHEYVVVTPSDAVEDPLAQLFASTGITASCVSGVHALDDVPLAIEGSLNDWARFMRPGKYTVVVSSTRLNRRSRNTALLVTSSPVTLTITPFESAWAAAEVLHAADLIDRGDRQAVRHGTAILRDLETEAAARALVERYDVIAAADENALIAAFASSPHRALIIQELEQRIDAGEDLPPTLIATLTRVRLLQELPPTQSNFEARQKRIPVVEAEYDARRRAAMLRRPVTVATLRGELARLLTNPRTLVEEQIADDLEHHPDEAVEAFVTLPPETQTPLLQSGPAWRWIKRSWIVEGLRQLYTASHGHPSPGGLPDGPGDPALARLYEMAPAVARPLMLEEIRTGAHGISDSTLTMLPDIELPELDSALQARYLSPRDMDVAATLGDRGTTAWLIARYASRALLPFVTHLIGGPLPGCRIEAALIAYLLKHDPPWAMKRLDPTFDRTRPGTCVVSPLGFQ